MEDDRVRVFPKISLIEIGKRNADVRGAKPPKPTEAVSLIDTRIKPKALTDKEMEIMRQKRARAAERQRRHRARKKALEDVHLPPTVELISLQKKREIGKRGPYKTRKRMEFEAALQSAAAQREPYRTRKQTAPASDTGAAESESSQGYWETSKRRRLSQLPARYREETFGSGSGRPRIPYKNFEAHSPAHHFFKERFINNDFGAICCVCDRIWHENEMYLPPEESRQILTKEFPCLIFKNSKVCNSCHSSLQKLKIPTLSKSNGFTYPMLPRHLPHLDLLSERLISPQLPFMQIRRLRHAENHHGIFGQIINVPVTTNNMVKHLPREPYLDFCVNVNIRRRTIQRSSDLMGVVKKWVVKSWLQHLANTPLYKKHDVRVDPSVFRIDPVTTETVQIDEVSEEIDPEECLVAQQQTLIWNEDMYLQLAAAENEESTNILFGEHCEELAFPGIYLGQPRKFKEDLEVTPFMIISSELRRADRRGVRPSHLLYMAMTIMRLRVRDSLNVALKFIGSATKSTDIIHSCNETTLAFLKCIPNSAFYWAQKKRDLSAMIRQLGKPTFFLTMSANEIGWPNLIKTLHKLKNKTDLTLSDEELANLDFNTKASLVNEDPVTCAIYFNKLIDTIMTILQSRKLSPFRDHYVKDYFKRIEFSHSGSPQAHILLWLNRAPKGGANGVDDDGATTRLIDVLSAVDERNSSGFLSLQWHEHTSNCFNQNNSNSSTPVCKFGAPFMPSPATVILTPMPKNNYFRAKYSKVYNRMWRALEENEYENIDQFLRKHGVDSYYHYFEILRAGITKPTVFLKRQPGDKWITPYNPFILNVLGSSMDIQYIIEENYENCASYFVDDVNKTERGISDLKRKIIQTMEHCANFNFAEVTKKLGFDLLNTVELSSQEAAWYLLRQPLSKSSRVVEYIPTIRPEERERVRRPNSNTNKSDGDDQGGIEDDSNWFEKYEKRPEEFEDLTLAQTVANFYVVKNQWMKRDRQCIIRYRNYDESAEPNEFKREMVTLHIPFRSEEKEILPNFMRLYEENKLRIHQQRREFESQLDAIKTLEICPETEMGSEDNEEENVPLSQIQDRRTKERGRISTVNVPENCDTIIDETIEIKQETFLDSNEGYLDEPSFLEDDPLGHFEEDGNGFLGFPDVSESLIRTRREGKVSEENMCEDLNEYVDVPELIFFKNVTEAIDAIEKLASENSNSVSKKPDEFPSSSSNHASSPTFCGTNDGSGGSNERLLNESDDDCGAFGDFVSAELRQIPSEERRNAAKNLIKKILLEMREESDKQTTRGTEKSFLRVKKFV